MFFSVFNENWKGVSKNVLTVNTHVFCSVLCDNLAGVMLHKECLKLVSTLDSLVENIKQKWKATRFRP